MLPGDEGNAESESDDVVLESDDGDGGEEEDEVVAKVRINVRDWRSRNLLPGVSKKEEDPIIRIELNVFTERINLRDPRRREREDEIVDKQIPTTDVMRIIDMQSKVDISSFGSIEIRNMGGLYSYFVTYRWKGKVIYPNHNGLFLLISYGEYLFYKFTNNSIRFVYAHYIYQSVSSTFQAI